MVFQSVFRSVTAEAKQTRPGSAPEKSLCVAVHLRLLVHAVVPVVEVVPHLLVRVAHVRLELLVVLLALHLLRWAHDNHR